VCVFCCDPIAKESEVISFDFLVFFQGRSPNSFSCGLAADEPEIGDVDEGVVEGGEDTGNAEDELAWLEIR